MDQETNEMTLMISNRQRKCAFCKSTFSRMISIIMYLLLLLSEVVVIFAFIYHFGKTISPVFTSKRLTATNITSSTKNTSHIFPIHLVRYLGMTETYSTLIMALNCLDTVSCWIFLGAVFKSPHFTGLCPLIKNLIRLPRFWTLMFVFVLVVMGNVIDSASSSLVTPVYKFRTMVAVCFTFSLDAFFVTMILGALNEMKVRQMAPGQVHLIFKGALIVFCFRLLVCLITTILYLTVVFYLIAGVKDSYWRKGGTFINCVSTFLFLPFYKKGTELVWTKIFRDDKFIIGKIRGPERQDSGLDSGI
ncbi:uncharacterized protein LOC111325359 [Stylophora pistillata]|uniref:uncharacterized protein LOC111325359 n=1 Tax=Stylophora pistillata TaxID=50429 RepID=UPI000C04E394|nr:uncharacterized protein LOC111325359 [Stylophora pistillata]XP_022784903.1 uncharacterized protein LOC111325359 [Stylophora pistillata]XP_022784904.1 uncharacterized protein LOC111325359 [Stylophora pistillata]